MTQSESIKNIMPAFVKAQSEMGKAVKGAENPFLHKEYADLPSVMEVVKEPLNNNGIAIMQPVDVDVVRTVLFHTSGEWLASEGTKIISGKPNDPQAQGSAITYAKRYDLQALLFVPTKDDDGEKAVERKPEVKPSFESIAKTTISNGTLATLKQREAVVKISDQRKEGITFEDTATWTFKQASDYIGNKGNGGYKTLKATAYQRNEGITFEDTGTWTFKQASDYIGNKGNGGV